MTNQTASVTCPGCEQQVSVAVPAQRTADEFHPYCDFPLFWASEVEFRPAPVAAPEPAMPVPAEDHEPKPNARAPAHIACPQCRTTSPAGASYCSSCGARLTEAGARAWHWVVWVLVLLLLVALAAGAVWGVVRLVT